MPTFLPKTQLPSFPSLTCVSVYPTDGRAVFKLENFWADYDRPCLPLAQETEEEQGAMGRYIFAPPLNEHITALPQTQGRN